MVLKYLYLITILLLLSISLPSSVRAKESGGKAEVKATIPARIDIRLFGYTAPNAIVQATGVRTFAQVLSDNKGYFLIDPLPIAREAKEICVMTVDSERRAGFPLCIDLPNADKSYEIGPVLLSPTLSLTKGSLWQNETAGASGMTIPEAAVTISFFETPIFTNRLQASANSFFSLFNPIAEAAGIPILSATSDAKGNFSINLPSFKAIGYRVFVKAIYKESPTPKSQTLSYLVNPFIDYWWKYILPKLLLFFFLMLILLTLFYTEIKTKKGRLLWAKFNEKKLKPFEVRLHLQFARILYNLQEYLRSNRK